MKKYFIKLMVIIISLFMFCSNVLAYTSTLVASKTTVNPGNTFTININLSGITNGLGSAEYTLGFDNTLFEVTKVSTTATNNTLASSVKFTFVDMTGSNPKKNGTFATVTFKVKNVTSDKTGSFTLTSKETADSTGSSISSTNKGVSVKVHIPDTDNTLKSLTINGSSISGFNSSTLNYNYKTDSSSIKIAAVANSSVAKVSGVGSKNVNYGTNTYNIVVTAENGSKKTYKITVTRDDKRETINTLNNLSIEGHNISPAFNKTVINYTLSVDSNISKVKVNVTKTSDKSSFVSGFGPREVNLDYGENKIYVKVKSENEKVNTYTITINRKDSRSSNNNLKSLTSSIGNIEFDKNTTTYSILTDQNEITINGEVEDSKAIVDGIKTYKLKDGVNEIKVNVKAENEKIKTYIIKVTKVSDFSTLNISNSIKGLSVLKKYGIDFKKDVLEYNLSIGNESSLELDLELEDSNATYEVKGNENLKDGSIIRIIVTGIDGKSKEYKINISKSTNSDDILPPEKRENKLPIILLVISCVINIILLILLVFKNKNNKKEINNEVQNEVNVEETNEEEKVLPEESVQEKKEDNE